MQKNVVNQNWLALRRYEKLFRDLTLEQREEILFDMEHEMIEGENAAKFTDRGIFRSDKPKAAAGKERYQEGSGGSMRNPGATIRSSKPHVHDKQGRHIPVEGGERKG